MKHLLLSLVLIISANAWSHDEISKECEENALNKFSEIDEQIKWNGTALSKKGAFEVVSIEYLNKENMARRFVMHKNNPLYKNNRTLREILYWFETDKGFCGDVLRYYETGRLKEPK